MLFLDEPTVGLDPSARQGVWQRVRELRDEFGTTILMTTHDMDEADELCKALAFMHRGRLLGMEPADLPGRRPAPRDFAVPAPALPVLTGVATRLYPRVVD